MSAFANPLARFPAPDRADAHRAAAAGGVKKPSNQTDEEQAGHGVMDFTATTRTVYVAG